MTHVTGPPMTFWQYSLHYLAHRYNQNSYASMCPLFRYVTTKNERKPTCWNWSQDIQFSSDLSLLCLNSVTGLTRTYWQTLCVTTELYLRRWLRYVWITYLSDYFWLSTWISDPSSAGFLSSAHLTITETVVSNARLMFCFVTCSTVTWRRLLCLHRDPSLARQGTESMALWSIPCRCLFVCVRRQIHRGWIPYQPWE